MAVYETVLVVGHTRDNLFQLVSDVRRYPSFVRWIKGMRVEREKMSADGFDLVAEAIVGFQGLTERFTTKVVAHAPSATVHVNLVQGPFRRLENSWELTNCEDEAGTRIKFRIDYQFKNPLLQMLLVTNFDKAVDRLMQSFLEEANRRHGEQAWRVVEIKRV